MSNDSKQSTALAVVQPGSIAVIQDPGQVAEIPQLIIDSVDDIFHLPKVTVPSGGALYFTLKTPTGERPVDSIEGVIGLMHTKQRAFYPTKFGEGDKGPPSCMSTNGKTGVGLRHLPGDGETRGPHDCMTCPNNDYGSKQKRGLGEGKGRACSEIIRMFVFDRDAFIPLSLKVPPTSLEPARTYRVMLLNDRGTKPHHVVTKIGLVKRTFSGKDVAVLTFTAVGKLSPEERARFDELHAGLERAFSPHMGSLLENEPRDVEVDPVPFDVPSDAPSAAEAGEAG